LNIVPASLLLRSITVTAASFRNTWNFPCNSSTAAFSCLFPKDAAFRGREKKHEFPDAFAQHALGQWCTDNNCEMYVVSADSDWQSTIVKGLIPLRKLEEFINAAVTDHNQEPSTRAMTRYEKHIETVTKAVTEAFHYSGFITDDVDGDVEGVKVTRLELNDPELLEVDEDSATISVSVDLDYVADVSYEDDDGGIWDGEDHTWAYRPTKRTDVEESENFDAELSIQFDPQNDEVFDVSCSIVEDFSVTVLPSDYELK
jgi:hypothetical protein